MSPIEASEKWESLNTVSARLIGFVPAKGVDSITLRGEVGFLGMVPAGNHFSDNRIVKECVRGG